MPLYSTIQLLLHHLDSLTLSCNGVFSYSFKNVSPIDLRFGSELLLAADLLMMDELNDFICENTIL